MDFFFCATCGEDVKIYEGVLSWLKKEGELTNFRVTHRNGNLKKCEVEVNNQRQELYKVASLSGYLAFVEDLLSWWEKGFLLGDYEHLKGILQSVSFYINERLASLIGE
ncbi:MAG: hypothetical protein ACPLQO_01575 [Desulfotomaculales bacterium]